MENWKVKISDVGYKLEKDVYIYYKQFGDKIGIIHGDTIETVNGGEQVKPTIVLPDGALQAFADALDAMGIKPQQGFIEGKLQATEKHLEDMRTLVFKSPANTSETGKK